MNENNRDYKRAFKELQSAYRQMKTLCLVSIFGWMCMTALWVKEFLTK